MTIKQYIKHLAIITKRTCERYELPTNIDLEKYRSDDYEME